MKRGKKIMLAVLSVISVIVISAVIFFNVPYSGVKSEFNKAVKEKIEVSKEYSGVFTEDDIKDLPLPVRKYFRYSGFLGYPKMSYMKATFKNVDFKMSADKTLKIDYTQYNFVERPERFALISSSLFGIPFEGIDRYGNGTGSMKGVLAKLFTLFDQRGESMDKACLVTVLAECLVVPNVALQDYITWEEIDETHAKATISYYGISAGGVFVFDEEGALRSFTTGDRVAVDMDGTERQAEWTAVLDDYRERDGLRLPTVLQSVWHFPEGDFLYFNENKAEVVFEYK